MNNAELQAQLEATDSPIDRTLGLSFAKVDQETGACSLNFTIGREFTNPMGVVFGGIQTSMLDAALSLAGTVKSGLTHGMVSLEIKKELSEGCASWYFSRRRQSYQSR